MGKYEKGILGSFSGKVGTVVGGSWRGIDYMRSKGRKSSKAATEQQLIQQAKFKVVTQFVHRLGKLCMISFKNTPAMTGINEAFRYNYENALTGTYPAFALDYSQALVSRGDLQNGLLPTATAAGSGAINFAWQDNSGDTLAHADDKAVLVVYCPENKQAIWQIATATRSDAAATLAAGNLVGKTVQSWISFVSKNGNEFASSIFTGELIVS